MSSVAAAPRCTDAATVAAWEAETKKTVREFKEFAKDSAKWTDVSDADGVKITSQASEGSRSIFKGVGICTVPIYVVAELLADTQKKAAYDSAFEKATPLESYSDNIWIELQSYFAPFPVTNRDFVMLMTQTRSPSGTIYLAGKSVTHEKAPVTSKYVRATVFIGGWALEPIKGPNGEDHTRVTFITSCDLSGSIPEIFKSRLDKQQPALVNTIRPFLQKRMEEIEKSADPAALKKQLEKATESYTIYTDEQLAA